MSTQQTVTTTTTTTTSPPFTQKLLRHVKSRNGIIRIAEGLLCLIAFIMVATLRYESWQSYVEFSTSGGFFDALIYFFINLFLSSWTRYKPLGTLIELILSAVWFVFILIAGIVAAVEAPSQKIYVGNYYEVSAAIAAFSFFSAVAYGVGTFYLYKDWRSQGGSLGTTTRTTTHTTTTTVPA